MKMKLHCLLCLITKYLNVRGQTVHISCWYLWFSLITLITAQNKSSIYLNYFHLHRSSKSLLYRREKVERYTLLCDICSFLIFLFCYQIWIRWCLMIALFSVHWLPSSVKRKKISWKKSINILSRDPRT